MKNQDLFKKTMFLKTGEVSSDCPFTSFIYQLLMSRGHNLSVIEVHDVLEQVLEDNGEKISFSNGYIAEFSQLVTKELKQLEANKLPVIQSKEKQLWVDIETGGFDPSKDALVEVAAIITNTRGRVIDAAYYCINPRTNAVGEQEVGEWSAKTHSETGLMDDIEKHGVSLEIAEVGLLDFINKYFDKKERPVMHGASIHFDKMFLDHKMPKLKERSHYRLHDVSTLKQFMDTMGIHVSKFAHETAHNEMEKNYERLSAKLTELDVATIPEYALRREKHRAIYDIMMSLCEYREIQIMLKK